MSVFARTLACATAAALLLTACGGRKTTASKSAEAFREAQAKGVVVGGGHGHPAAPATETKASAVDHAAMGHGTADPGAQSTAATTHEHGSPTTASQQHAAHTGPIDHAAMGHGTVNRGAQSTTAKQHAAHTGPVDHAAMGHGTPGKRAAVKHQHGSSPTPAPQHQHDATAASAATHVHGAASVSASSPLPQAVSIGPLRQDEFDAPVPVAVAEAAKASGSGHAQHDASPARAPEAAPSVVVYECPMHPEVTSDKPGSCPKCGMALVKKE